MEVFLQPLIMAFREGLEAFLIIAILLKFLDKTDNKKLKNSVWNGTYIGIGVSIVFGFILHSIASTMGNLSTTAKLWESGSSFLAVLLVTTFIIWMITHGTEIKQHIEKKAAVNLSKKGLFLLAMIAILREGVEIAIFAFAGKYTVFPVILGISSALVLAILIHHSLIKVNLNTLFTVTLAYLILQAGFLLGYSTHEGIEALEEMGRFPEGSFLFEKAYNLSGTVLDHKQGIIGMPLYVTVGWYSKPEWLQLIFQFTYITTLFTFWKNHSAKIKASKKRS